MRSKGLRVAHPCHPTAAHRGDTDVITSWSGHLQHASRSITSGSLGPFPGYFVTALTLCSRTDTILRFYLFVACPLRVCFLRQ